MSDDVRRLLAGPRGLRLCLDAAIGVELERLGGESLGPLGMAVFHLAIGEPHVAWFRFGDEELPPRTEAADVLRELRTLPVGPVPDEDLRALLQGVVDAARYWQEPDRQDSISTEPAIIDALTPWAEAICATSLARWWDSPAGLTDQVAAHHPQWAPPASAAAGLAHDLERIVEAERRSARERRQDPRANISGMWWSSPVWLESSTRCWPGTDDPLGAALTEDAACQPEEMVRRRVTPPPSARVLEIRDADAWASLCREHPLTVTASKLHDWYRCTGRAGEWVIPDWAAVAREWDGVHLPVLPYLELAGRTLPVDGERASVIAGWSPDQTFWFIDL